MSDVQLSPLQYMVLSVFCAAPLTVSEASQRLDARFGQQMLDCSHKSVVSAVTKLSRCGYLAPAGKAAPGAMGPRPQLHVLTAAGEAALDLEFARMGPMQRTDAGSLGHLASAELGQLKP